MNSGVFVCERGTSSTYTAILSKQDVLEASEMECIPHTQLNRIVGGGFLDKLKSTFSHLKSFAPLIKQGLQLYSKSNGKYGDVAKTGADVLGALGMGMNASGRSAGSSGGSLKHRLR
jgi:hypothetical protein